MAFNAGGRRAATCRPLKPPQLLPIMPTLPLHHGWREIQSITSRASSVPDADIRLPCGRRIRRCRAYPRGSPHSPGWRNSRASARRARAFRRVCDRDIFENGRNRRLLRAFRQPEARSKAHAVAHGDPDYVLLQRTVIWVFQSIHRLLAMQKPIGDEGVTAAQPCSPSLNSGDRRPRFARTRSASRAAIREPR